MATLSVVLAVYNEERNIDRCLSAISNIASEIVIVDGESNDSTVSIARRYNAKIIIRPNQENFHINKKTAIEKATKDWIFQLDADEVVSMKLKAEIKRTLESNPEENGFWIPRRNYFLGKFLSKGGTYPDTTIRLYRRGKGSLPAKSVHEQATVEGKTGYLSSPLLHYSNGTFGEFIEKRFNRYSDLMSNEVRGGWVEYLIWKPMFDSRQGFVPVYFRHLGILDGFPGFIWALFQDLLFPIAYFKSKRTDSNI